MTDLSTSTQTEAIAYWTGAARRVDIAEAKIRREAEPSESDWAEIERLSKLRTMVETCLALAREGKFQAQRSDWQMHVVSDTDTDTDGRLGE